MQKRSGTRLQAAGTTTCKSSALYLCGVILPDGDCSILEKANNELRAHRKDSQLSGISIFLSRRLLNILVMSFLVSYLMR